MQGFELLKTEVLYSVWIEQESYNKIDRQLSYRGSQKFYQMLKKFGKMLYLQAFRTFRCCKQDYFWYSTFDTNIKTTCEIKQECDANGYTRAGCKACSKSGSTILYGLILFLIF